MKSMKAMIFDIDGCLADVTTISHMLGEFPKAGETYVEYEDYHKLAVDVPVVPWVFEMACLAAAVGYNIFLATSRRTTFLNHTGNFILKKNIPCEMCFMREPDDERSGADLKKDILNRIRSLGYTVEQAFDDDPAIIEMYEAEGVEAFLVVGYGFNYGE